MDHHVLEAKHLGGWRIWLRFRDGTEGEIDLETELVGPVFDALRDPQTFRSFRVDPEFHTLVWPNGADLAPEFLYKKARRVA